MSLNGNAKVDLSGYRHINENAKDGVKTNDNVSTINDPNILHLSLSDTGDLILEVHVGVQVGGDQDGKGTVVNIQEIVNKVSKCTGCSKELRDQLMKFDFKFSAPTNLELICTNFSNELNKMISFNENPNRVDGNTIKPLIIKPLTCQVPYSMHDGRTVMGGTPLWAIRNGTQRIVTISQNTLCGDVRRYCYRSIDSMTPGSGHGAEYRDDKRSVAICQGSDPYTVVAYVLEKGQIPELSTAIADHMQGELLITSATTYTAILNAFAKKLNMVHTNTYDMSCVEVLVKYCPAVHEHEDNNRSETNDYGFVTVRFTIESAIRPCGYKNHTPSSSSSDSDSDDTAGGEQN